MNRSGLVRQVAGPTGLDATPADALTRGEAVRLAGFGTFGTKERAAPLARDPRTGARRDAFNPARGYPIARAPRTSPAPRR